MLKCLHKMSLLLPMESRLCQSDILGHFQQYFSTMKLCPCHENALAKLICCCLYLCCINSMFNQHLLQNLAGALIELNVLHFSRAECPLMTQILYDIAFEKLSFTQTSEITFILSLFVKKTHTHVVSKMRKNALK